MDHEQLLKNEVAKELQKLADFRFGSKAVKVECVGVQSGSMIFVVVVTAKQVVEAGGITAVVATGYRFVIDYDKFCKNVPLMVADIRRYSSRIKQAVQSLLGEPYNPFRKNERDK